MEQTRFQSEYYLRWTITKSGPADEGAQRCVCTTVTADEPSLTSSPENVLERAIFIDWCKSSSAGTRGADNICTGLSAIRSLISAPIPFFCFNSSPLSLITHSSVAPRSHEKRTNRQRYEEVEEPGANRYPK
ncbi:uncharacterized [Tachysurus ichikawai]